MPRDSSSRSGIDTERLRLTPFADEDVDAVCEFFRQPGVRRYLWDDRLAPVERVRSIQARSDEGFASGRFGLWVSRLSDGRSIIGLAGFYPYHDPPEIELMYSLTEAHWGCGLAREMSEALVAWAFDELDLPILQASMDPPNEASARLAERLGMHRFEHPLHQDGSLLFYRRPRATASHSG